MKTLAGAVTWVDIVKPTASDIAFLKGEHAFHPIILDELLHQSARARVEHYEDYLYLTYHLPIYDPSTKTSRRAEIDFLITRKTVYTIRYEALEAIDTLMGEIQASSDFRERALGSTVALTYQIIESNIRFALRQLRHIEEHIRGISHEIFKGHERDLLKRISYVKRDLLDYHLISRPQKILLASLTRVGSEFWDRDAQVYLDDLAGDDLKVQQHIESYLEIIESLEETNSQLLDSKINRSMHVFTVLAFFTFPLVLFTSVYQVAERSGSFWIGFGVIAITTLILPFVLLKRNIF